MTPISRNGEPTYKRIQNVIRKRIESGQLRPGDAVASERELAKMHKVSLMTARHALADLAREGMVETASRLGHVCGAPENTLQQANELYGANGQPRIGGQVEDYFVRRAGHGARNRGTAFVAVFEQSVHARTRATSGR